MAKGNPSQLIPPVLNVIIPNGNEYYSVVSHDKYRVCDSCYFEKAHGGCNCTITDVKSTRCKSNGINIIWRKKVKQ